MYHKHIYPNFLGAFNPTQSHKVWVKSLHCLGWMLLLAQSYFCHELYGRGLTSPRQQTSASTRQDTQALTLFFKWGKFIKGLVHTHKHTLSKQTHTNTHMLTSLTSLVCDQLSTTLLMSCYCKIQLCDPPLTLQHGYRPIMLMPILKTRIWQQWIILICCVASQDTFIKFRKLLLFSWGLQRLSLLSSSLWVWELLRVMLLLLMWVLFYWTGKKAWN